MTPRSFLRYLLLPATPVGLLLIAFMTLGFAAKQSGLDRVPVETIRARAEAAGIAGLTRYWTPEIHVGAFNLPPYIAQHLPR